MKPKLMFWGFSAQICEVQRVEAGSSPAAGQRGLGEGPRACSALFICVFDAVADPALLPSQVDIHIMTQPPSGEWVYFDTEISNSSGRISYVIPENRRLGIGVYPVKMVVRYLGVLGLSLQEEQTRNSMTVEYGPSLWGTSACLGGLRVCFASNRDEAICVLQL